MPLILLALAAGCLLLGLVIAARRRRGFVCVHPAWRAWLHQHGLVGPSDFLSLDGVVVGGHRGRHVVRVELPGGKVAFLKRDERAGWVSRLTSWWAGMGFASPPLREASMLQALERDGLPAPRFLAAGEDGRGRAFLLVEAVAGAEALPERLNQCGPGQRRQLARALGRLLARLHAAGFFHHDLYAKHVLVSGEELCLIDWQRAWRGTPSTAAARVRDLAALDATLPDELAPPRDRLALLRAYLSCDSPSGPGATHLPALAHDVRQLSAKLLTHRHVREKRQPAAADQSWRCLDGEALCLTPAFEGDHAWLALSEQPAPANGPVARRWVELPDGRRALLVRRRQRAVGAGSPEMGLANLLWRLRRHGVECPQVLAAGQRQRDGWLDAFVLTHPPGEAVRLEAWFRRPSPHRPEVLRRLGEVVRRMHEGCCYLGRPALEAFAVEATEAGPRVVLLGAEGVEPARRPDSRRQARDMALLRDWLAQRAGPEEWRMVEENLGRPSGLPPGASPPRRPAPAPQGPPRDNLLQRWWHGGWRVWCRDDWPQFAGADWLQRIMDVPVTDRFHAKQGRSTGRLVLQSPDGRRLVVYLKRHYQLPWWDRLMGLLWPGPWSPAMQEFNNLEWARRQGVPVPNVVAVGERSGPGFSLVSFLAVEELTGMLALHEAIPMAQEKLSPDDFRRWKQGLAVEMARVSRLLHDRHHFHKDLYLCHFYVREEDLGRPVEDWRGRVSLIDLHRLGHHPWTWRVWQLKDLAQLLYSSDVPGITARDRLAFWRAYLGPETTRAYSRWLRWWVSWKWGRYRQHNLRKKAQAEGQPS